MNELQKLQEVTATLRQQLDAALLQNEQYRKALEELRKELRSDHEREIKAINRELTTARESASKVISDERDAKIGKATITLIRAFSDEPYRAPYQREPY